MSWSVYYSGPTQIYLRVRVTANGQTTTGFRTVYVNNFRTQDAMASKDTANWQQVIEHTENKDGTVVLRDAYPNPLTNQSQLGFTIAQPETVSLDILTLDGRWVKQVTGGTLEAGYHEVALKREGLSARFFVVLYERSMRLLLVFAYPIFRYNQHLTRHACRIGTKRRLTRTLSA